MHHQRVDREVLELINIFLRGIFDNYSKHLIVANQSNTVPDKNESILSVQGLGSHGNVKSYSTNNFLPKD